MASPFPGMDPYLEGSLWMTVHSQLIPEFARQLSPQILPKYLALTSKRFVIDLAVPDDPDPASLYPDLGMVTDDPSGGNGTKSAGSIAPLTIQTCMPEEFPLFSVRIVDVEQRRLVTVIELLSPTNKRGRGHEKYIKRRNRYLRSETHLLEIDLLRGGHRVPMREPLPAAAYFAMLSRAYHRPLTDVWPIGLRDPLPPVPVPLLSGDADVRLDLQAALTNVYDLLGYRYALNYAEPPPPPPLAENDLAWIRSRVQSIG